MRTQEEHTAHHEAGHFVAHELLMPGDAGTVTIVPNEEAGSLGHHSPIDGLQDRPRAASPEEYAENKRLGVSDPTIVGEYDAAEVETFVVILYAGAAAELYLDPSSSRAAEGLSEPTAEQQATAEKCAGALMTMGSDWEKAEAYLALLAPDLTERANIRERCRKGAKELVAEHWREIQAVAAELLQQKTFTGSVGRMILDLVNGIDTELVAQGLALHLGSDKAAAVLARHGYSSDGVRVLG